MAKLTLSQPEPGCWRIEGDLTNQTVAREYKTLQKNRPVSGQWQIDLSQADQVDSAGVAFLLECLRYSQTQDVELRLKGLSSKVGSLIEVQGVSNLLKQYEE